MRPDPTPVRAYLRLLKTGLQLEIALKHMTDWDTLLFSRRDDV